MNPAESTRSEKSCRARSSPGIAPAAKSLSDWIITRAASAGTQAIATAGKWRGGVAWKLCAVISRPMKTRIGRIAGPGMIW